MLKWQYISCGFAICSKVLCLLILKICKSSTFSHIYILTVLWHPCRDDREQHVSDEEDDRRSKQKRKGVSGGGSRDAKRSRR